MFMPGVWFLWSKKNIIFQREKGYTFTFLIIFIVKSIQKEQNSTNILLWPQSAGINVQSPQSESTPRRLTLDRHLEPYISRSTFLIRITLTMLRNYSLIINLKSSKHVKMLGEEGKVSINEKMCCSDIQTKSKLGNSRMTQ